MTVARRMQRGIVIGNTPIGYAGLSRLAEMSQLSPLCNEKESYGLPYAPTRDRDGWMDAAALTPAPSRSCAPAETRAGGVSVAWSNSMRVRF
jgi:hypothetical protein